VVGPEFGPLAGLCVAIVQRRPAEARRSLLALVVGFPVGMLATIGLVLLLTATGQLDSSMLTADRPDTSFIYHPDSLSFVVAFLASAGWRVPAATEGSGSSSVTDRACSPRRPSTMPNSTRAPGLSAGTPAGSAEEWTKTSPPSSRERKPKPLSVSYHLTLPVG